MALDERTAATFGELIDQGVLEIGDGYRAKNSELGGDGLFFLRAGHVTDTHINFDGVDRFHAHLEPRVHSKLARSGDTIVTTKGNSTGRTSYVKAWMPPFVYSPHLSYWRSLDHDVIEPRFLRYWSRAPEFTAQLAGMKASTDMAPYLSLVDQKHLQISLLPVSEQRAIAHILGTLDDKIELNRRMSETLEAMARTLFKSWFVDFDPVRAKIDGRWKPGQSLPGLPAHLYDLFPDRLFDSDHGEIPEGWEVVSLQSIVETVKGRSYKSSELAESNNALVTLKSFERGGGYRPDGLKPFTGDFKQEQIVLPGEVVIACTDVTQAADVIGRPATVRANPRFQNLIASLDTMILRPRQVGVTPSYIYFLCRSELFVAHAYAYTTGTTVLHLAKEAFPSFLFACPPENLLNEFELLAKPALSRIGAGALISSILATLRDTLLPKLISGELNVKNAERLIQGITK